MLMSQNLNKRTILCVLDGWGIASAGPGNAITLADPPTYKFLLENYPNSQLQASGVGVGLPEGADGNSETGHLNIGAGRIVYQDLPRINMSIADGSFFENQAFLKAINYVKKNNSTLHLLGLIGDSGVHAYNDHLYALLLLAAKEKVSKVCIHLITDGRDSPPKDALNQIILLRQNIARYGVGKIVSIMGRYYGMDRDLRLDRTKLAFDCLTDAASSPNAPDAETAIKRSYVQEITDEFIKPTTLGDNPEESRIKSNDGAIFYNFRVDRPRQLTHMFLEDLSKNLVFVTMTNYHKNFVTPAAFSENKLQNTLPQAIAQAGLTQLHASESEKERFVTYYFNGQNEETESGEDRLIIPSPKIATYDLQPEMSTNELIEAFSEHFLKKPYAFGVLNIACPDMVGHTSSVEACKKAVLAADHGLKRLMDLADKTDSYLLIVADHGNVEELINLKTGGVDTKHSTNPVPFIIYNKEDKDFKLQNGVLADIAPTLLSLLEIQKPIEMTGHNLVTRG
jgi:2,3-bisphosphoglycerate-independent phosphoglycerate mutase